MSDSIHHIYLFLGLVLLICFSVSLGVKEVKNTLSHQLSPSAIVNTRCPPQIDYTSYPFVTNQCNKNVTENFATVVRRPTTTVVSRPSTVVVGGGVSVVPTVPVYTGGSTTVINTTGGTASGSGVVVTRTQSPLAVFFIGLFVVLIIIMIIWFIFTPVTYVDYIDNASNTVVIV